MYTHCFLKIFGRQYWFGFLFWLLGENLSGNYCRWFTSNRRRSNQRTSNNGMDEKQTISKTRSGFYLWCGSGCFARVGSGGDVLRSIGSATIGLWKHKWKKTLPTQEEERWFGWYLCATPVFLLAMDGSGGDAGWILKEIFSTACEILFLFSYFLSFVFLRSFFHRGLFLVLCCG